MNTVDYKKYLKVNKKVSQGIRKVYKFENGRGASVICGPYSYGGKKGFYKLVVLDENGNLDYTTPIKNDVIGWLTWEEVIGLLRQIKELKP